MGATEVTSGLTAGLVAAYPSDKNKCVARVGHPGIVAAHPRDKNKYAARMGHLGIVAAYPSDKNKCVARVGHLEGWAGQGFFREDSEEAVSSM
jgi:hypothetical protein